MDLFTRIGVAILLFVGGGLWVFSSALDPSIRHTEVSSPPEFSLTKNVVGAPIDLVQDHGFPRTIDDQERQNDSLSIQPGASCTVLQPHQGFVEEILVRFADDGSKSYERRVALVIGNGDYQGAIGKLDNPANDATSMANVMSALGFTVYRGIDLDADGIEKCLNRFTTELQSKPTDIALFFYAGHGIQLVSEKDNEKRNYMIATDARIEASGEGVGYKQIDAVLNQMRDHSEQSVFFYDACRNYPLGDQKPEIIDGVAIKRGIGLLSGAATVNLKQQEADDRSGIYIAYATAPNRVADDAYERGADHSPFTKALLNNIAMPGYPLKRTMSNVSNAVGELTDWNQTPWTNSSLTGDIYLNGASDKASAELQARRLTNIAEDALTAQDRATSMANALKALSMSWHPKADNRFIGIAKSVLYRANYNKVRAILDDQDSDLYSAAWSPDGTLLATGSLKGPIKVWKVPSLRLHGQVDTSSPVMGLEFSQDGKLLLAVLSRNAEGGDLAEIFRVTDLSSKVRLSDGHTDSIFHARFSPDQSKIVTASGDGSALIWDVNSGSAETRLNLKDTRAAASDFTPDGALLLVADSTGHIHVFNPVEKKFLRSFKAHESWITGLDVSPSGKQVATASLDNTASIWDISSGEQVGKLIGHSSYINDIEFSYDGKRIVLAASDNAISIWDTASLRLLHKLEGHPGAVIDAKFDPQGSFISAIPIDGRGIFLWDRRSIEYAASFDAGNSQVLVSIFSPDAKKVYTGHRNGYIQEWSRSGELLWQHQAVDEYLSHLSLSADGKKLAAGSYFSGLKVIDIENRKLSQTIIQSNRNSDPSTESDYPLDAMSASSDGRFIATVPRNEKTIHLWDTSAGELFTTFSYNTFITGVSVSPDSRYLASGSYDGSIFVYDLESKTKIYENNDRDEAIGAMAFSDNSKILAAPGRDKTVHLLAIPSGRIIQILPLSMQHVAQAKFSADAELLFTLSRGFVSIWDVSHGTLVDEIKVGTAGVRSIDTSLDGSELLVGTFARSADIWPLQKYGPSLISSAFKELTPELRAEVERERIRYWEVDPAVLQ